ncbi:MULTISPECIES: hypothetical protein [unclassified Enterococcus]|uniref:hypothetical protein n=1 Tax=unclassified Enterococcus TaxID=2608891 RepID=UPI001555BB1E|nr:MULTISPECIES: hypothetical protein [unclassified Enterococcus]MBS7576874.1 hypothetical protein [Enterococcus sp. MMGLQ5-2]MBS7584281.1 hypothetical protein [Enterococcus sp. MMGLQ5-1]NPD12137.1 hypothetical protein [Enterococcus sp. MMGLQ5-1]NPD36709.1 hypothetical protein [Enterococcus sp. MMGLQ5-2]
MTTDQEKTSELFIRKAKTWNIVTLVIASIGLVANLFSISSVLNPDIETFRKIGASTEYLNYLQSTSLKAFSIVGIIISIVLVVLYVMNQMKLSKNQLAPKFPYYIYIGWSVLSYIIGLLAPKMQIEGMDFGMITTLLGIAFRAILFIPAILVIYYLFKAEPEDADEKN